MTTERKRLMVPVVKDPRVLVIGNPGDGFDYYGPTPLDDGDGYQEARTRWVEERSDDGIWWSFDLLSLSELPTIDGRRDDKPSDPIEDKRDEFLRKAAQLREMGDDALSRSGNARAILLTDEVLALAEELLA